MHITAAESFIMEALWRRGPLTADDLIDDPGKPQGWGGATVKTLINRLLKKGALKSERIDGRVRYVAQIERADYVQSESQGLLDRLFGGRLAPLVTQFSEGGKLSEQDIAELKALIERIGK